jgi:hypothetical protein
MGSLDHDGVEVAVPNALARLSRNLDPCNYDSSGMGPGLDIVGKTRTCMSRDLGDSEEATIWEIEIRRIVYSRSGTYHWLYSDVCW